MIIKSYDGFKQDSWGLNPMDPLTFNNLFLKNQVVIKPLSTTYNTFNNKIIEPSTNFPTIKTCNSNEKELIDIFCATLQRNGLFPPPTLQHGI